MLVTQSAQKAGNNLKKSLISKQSSHPGPEESPENL